MTGECDGCVHYRRRESGEWECEHGMTFAYFECMDKDMKHYEVKDEVDDLRKQLNVARTDINDLAIRVSKLEADLEREKKRAVEPPRFIYVIRERTREFTAGSDWNIVGNVVYPTFNDANEKLKKLIKDYRQLDPDYNANNLNIIQVRLEG